MTDHTSNRIFKCLAFSLTLKLTTDHTRRSVEYLFEMLMNDRLQGNYLKHHS